MFPWAVVVPLVPPYLVAVTVVFVVLPSVVATLLRFALHQHLVFLDKRVRRLINRAERGEQPKIVKELEIRFREASRNLERVNTVALIDQTYSQEKVWFIDCEQIDYFCRLLPNLLLAFGLLGTFLGITINLSALSQTISQTNTGDVSSLVRELQEPLQGMGIAFIASLLGILFSALLTVVNLIKNTNLAKYKLISSLEDYLDNIYQPSLPGHTRIDKAVDRLVFEFQNFLGRFGTTVREAVESSLGQQIKQIVDVNKQSSELARQVYSGFQESSGTIARSASDFQIAADRFTEVAQLFERNQFAQILADATKDLASTQKDFSQSASSLAESVKYIEIAVTEIHVSNQNLVNLKEEITTINETSIQVLELLDTLNNHTKQVRMGIQSLGERLVNSNKYQSHVLVENIHECINYLSDTKQEIYTLSKILGASKDD